MAARLTLFAATFVESRRAETASGARALFRTAACSGPDDSHLDLRAEFDARYCLARATAAFELGGFNEHGGRGAFRGAMGRVMHGPELGTAKRATFCRSEKLLR